MALPLALAVPSCLHDKSRPMKSPNQKVIGRGAEIEPPNRFESIVTDADLEQLEHDEQLAQDDRRIPTQFLTDQTRSIITHNDSPDVPFRYSINPYRGCEHGCAYCYARPGHEYLGMNAGLDFETNILVKLDAAEAAARRTCANRPGSGEMSSPFPASPIATSPPSAASASRAAASKCCSKPAKRSASSPKTRWSPRDLDLLAPLAKQNMCAVYLSITTLDADLARDLEPRTTPPAKLASGPSRELSAAGVPVGVMTAPIIPGLNDTEIPAILKPPQKPALAAPVGHCSGSPLPCARSSKIGSPAIDPTSATALLPAFRPSAAAK